MIDYVGDYLFGPHLKKRIESKKILLKDVLRVIKEDNVHRIRGSDGATKLVFNKTKIRKSLRKANNSDKRELERLYKEGGLTVVLNEETKFIITAY